MVTASRYGLAPDQKLIWGFENEFYGQLDIQQ